MLTTRIAAPLTACVIAALALPATADAAASTASSGHIEHVLLTLKPQDRGALRALARAGLPRGSARAGALAAALPSAAQRADVAASARRLGLTVERSTRMAVLVSAPASRIRALFGSARSVDPRSPMQHPLPTLPGALRGTVTVAFGGDDNRPAFRHFALPDGTADGTDFRTAYGNSVTDPLAPPTTAEQAETIATVQLSGWHASDLTKYAAFLRQQTGNASWPAPKYQTVDDPLLPSCIATDSNNCTNFPGDDIEVDLDQEAIYATAPYAKQRAYTSGNDFFGLYDSLATIGDDASDPTVDRHLVAASISWGFCETDLDSDPAANELYAAFEDVVSYDLATGVTVFSASGDSGGMCDGQTPGVSYPASSPQVVAVGGTQHASSVVTDPPQGWVDPGWTPGNSQGLGAGSGGVSEVFPAPDYQLNAGITTAGRAVPDISAVAGNPGFDVLTTSPSGPGTFPVGGTSLSSPVSAATYALQVARHGYSWGVGDILPGLYAQPASFTDVNDGCATADATCAGWNGVDVARAGYDLVTGLGTPNWSAVVSPALGGDPHLTVGKAYNNSTKVPVTVHTADWQNFDRFRIDVDSDHTCTLANASSTKPTSVRIDDFGFRGLADGVHDLTLIAYNSTERVCHFADAFVFVDTTKPAPLVDLSVQRGHNAVVASWEGGGDSGGSGIKTFHVTLRYGSHRVLSIITKHADSISVPAKKGKTYVLTVTATDRAGNVGTRTATLLDDTGTDLSGKWSKDVSAKAYEGSSSVSDRSGASSSTRLTGNRYVVYVTTCKSCGRVAVFIDGKKRKTIDTYSARTHHRVDFTLYTSLKNARRHIVFKVLGTHRSSSHGNRVFLDAVSAGSERF